MEKNVKNAVENYQCTGCINGSDISCFVKSEEGRGCSKHRAGTFMLGASSFFLGLPKGFCRKGEDKDLKPLIFTQYEGSGWEYDMWNIPVWKHLNKDGHTIVRGMMPRLNKPFLHVFLEDCREKINCLEITQEQVDAMD